MNEYEWMIYSITKGAMRVIFIIVALAIAYYGFAMLRDGYKARPDGKEKRRFIAKCAWEAIITTAIIAIPAFILRQIYVHGNVPILEQVHNWLNQY